MLNFWRHDDFQISDDNLDDCVAAYVEHLYHEGDSYSMASDTLAAVQYYYQRSIGKLKFSWKLCGIWKRGEPPKRVLPLLPLNVLALAGLAIDLQRLDLAALILIGFDGMLRTGELFNMRAFHIRFAKKKAFISLEYSKSGKRKGAEECVVIDSQLSVAVLRSLVATTQPTAFLRSTSPQQCRLMFKQMLDFFQLDLGRYNWYSLRRGGATAFFTRTASMEQTLIRGRWESATTARIYIQEATAQSCDASFTPTQVDLFKASAHRLRDFVATSDA